jgi:hypothetical protein
LNQLDERAAVWRSLGASAEETSELLAYAEDGFDRTIVREPPAFPLDDEPFVPVWEEYIAASMQEGAVAVLAKRLVQLSFPIAAGISGTAAYRDATRRGVLAGCGGLAPLAFRDPDGIELFLHQSAAGRIPVILARERSDFESLVRALTRRNEPDPIPASMGACMVAGYNNWDRVARLRSRIDFAGILEDKTRYQDRFILLAQGPYSATPAEAFGLDEAAWLALSRTIRLEHECTHYFTRRVLGSMNNRLFDELIADYIGIVRATGRFRADWFLEFMKGRLGNYRGTLSEGAFGVLRRAVAQGASTLERFDAEMGGDPGRPAELARRILALAAGRLEDLASGLYRIEVGLYSQAGPVDPPRYPSGLSR